MPAMDTRPISGRRRQANRANAKLSTGPKSRSGKARSSQNALRHGLNLPIWSDPTLAPEAEGLARSIAGRKASNMKIELARQIASAQVDINRVRRLRTNMIGCLLSDPTFTKASALPEKIKSKTLIGLTDQLESSVMDLMNTLFDAGPLKGDEKPTFILEQKSLELMRLDRYERRALSRRKTAIRKFDAVL